MGIRGATLDYLVFEDVIFRLRPEKQEGAAMQRSVGRHSWCKGPTVGTSQAVERNRKKARMAGSQSGSGE